NKEWIMEQWDKKYYITSVAGALNGTAMVVMSKVAAEEAVVELDFLYPSEGIHRRWENGYWITSATADQVAFILSTPKKKSQDVAQETLRSSVFPGTQVKVHLHCMTTYSLGSVLTYV
ncbi:hypothetical protein CFOL_v3_07339, partial [Cephalotus follicularis]